MDIFQHFNSKERDFAKRVLASVESVKRNYIAKLLDFADPREQEIIQSIVKYAEDVSVEFNGGLNSSERSRAIILNKDKTNSVNKSDFEIVVFKATYANKFTKLEHRNMLGSLLSLGLKREKLGDIQMDETCVFFAVCSDVSNYIESNLQKIGSASITLERIDENILPKTDEAWIESVVSVSSMRLDVVISAITSLSRQQSQNLIGQGKVKVNWKEISSASLTLAENDILSIRGFGRRKIIKFIGQSKKGKMRIRVGELK